MPEETIEELKAKLSLLEENHKGQLDAMKKQLDDALAHTTALEEEVKVKDEKLSGYQKAERDALEAEAHALNKDYVTEGKSDLLIREWMDGYKGALEATKSEGHTAGTQKKSGTGVPPPGTPQKKEEDLGAQLLNM